MAQVIPLGRARRQPDRCQAMTVGGRACRNAARANGFCAVHQPPAVPERIGPFRADQVRDLLALARRRLTADYDVDEFGFDPQLTEAMRPVFRPIHRWYRRVDWIGLENVPSVGPALLVGNRPRAARLGAVIVKFGLLDVHPAHRHVRLLASDIALRTPVLEPLARKLGSALACDEDVLRLLLSGELVGAIHRGQVETGWIQAALRAKAPVVPIAITAPRLPSSWQVEFGEAIPTDGHGEDAWRNEMLVFDVADQVRDMAQEMLMRLER
jgi:hypothetical protein